MVGSRPRARLVLTALFNLSTLSSDNQTVKHSRTRLQGTFECFKFEEAERQFLDFENLKQGECTGTRFELIHLYKFDTFLSNEFQPYTPHKRDGVQIILFVPSIYFFQVRFGPLQSNIPISIPNITQVELIPCSFRLDLRI